MPQPGFARAAPSLGAVGPWMIRPDALRAIRAAVEPRSVYRPDPADDGDPGTYRPPPAPNAPGMVGGVAVIPIYGPIYRHETYYERAMAEIFGGTSLPSLVDSFRTALADPGVRAILFAIDSPGGVASGIADFAREIRAGASIKPVAAYAEGSCCSAAYYLAAACGEISAAADAMLGSIGVVFPAVDDSELMKALGVRDVSVVSSQSPDKWADPADEGGRPLWQATADALAERFVADVAEYRGVSAEAVLSDFGKGWVKVGDDARKAGMVDRIATFAGAVAKLDGRNRARLAVARPAAATPATAQVILPAPIRARLRPRSEERHVRILLSRQVGY